MSLKGCHSDPWWQPFFFVACSRNKRPCGPVKVATDLSTRDIRKTGYEHDAGRYDCVVGRLCAWNWHRICRSRMEVSQAPPPPSRANLLEGPINCPRCGRRLRILDFQPHLWDRTCATRANPAGIRGDETQQTNNIEPRNLSLLARGSLNSPDYI